MTAPDRYWEKSVVEDCWGFGNLDLPSGEKKKGIFIVGFDDYDESDPNTYSKIEVQNVYLRENIATIKVILNCFFYYFISIFNVLTVLQVQRAKRSSKVGNL